MRFFNFYNSQRNLYGKMQKFTNTEKNPQQIFLFLILFISFSPSRNRYRKRKLSFLHSVMVDGIWIQLIYSNLSLSILTHNFDFDTPFIFRDPTLTLPPTNICHTFTPTKNRLNEFCTRINFLIQYEVLSKKRSGKEASEKRRKLTFGLVYFQTHLSDFDAKRKLCVAILLIANPFSGIFAFRSIHSSFFIPFSTVQT